VWVGVWVCVCVCVCVWYGRESGRVDQGGWRTTGSVQEMHEVTSRSGS
jgi:hypothetical protein